MKNIIKFLIFLCYTIAIFFIQNYYCILGILVVNILLMQVYKINLKLALKNIVGLSGFILFTVIINILIENFQYSILIGIRLILVCNVTYTFSKVLTYMEFAKVIEKLLYPLKIFKINPTDISLVICIALSFFPILKDEMNQVKYALIVKGLKFSLLDSIKNTKVIFKPFLINIMQRVDEMEGTLKAKSYQE